MMTFHEYSAWRKKTKLLDPLAMMAKAGISPGAPHEVDVQRLVKREKRADEREPAEFGARIVRARSMDFIARPRKTT